jgi:hypothetical protein
MLKKENQPLTPKDLQLNLPQEKEYKRLPMAMIKKCAAVHHLLDLKITPYILNKQQNEDWLFFLSKLQTFNGFCFTHVLMYLP